MISRRSSTAWLVFAVVSMTSVLACQRVPLLAPSGSTITLSTTATALPVNGTTRVVAQILEAAGTPPQHGTHVTFTTTLGTIQPAETETDVSGQAIVTFNAGNASGTATITAISGGANVGSAGALKILVGTAAVGNVIVNANPTVVPSLGGSSTISAIVLDVNGNPLVSAPVSFSTTAGTLSTQVATTDSAGTAQTVLTTNTQATVTASVGAQGTTTTPPATGGGTTTPPASSGKATGTVTVGIAGSPTIVIAVAATPPPSAGLPVAFTFTITAATTNPSPIRSVTVNWGDGSAIANLGAIATTTTVNHVFGSPGTYIVTGTVTDAFGTTVPNSISVTVNPKPQPVVSLTAPTTPPTAGTDSLFTGSVAVAPGSNTVIQNVTIDFGDGRTDLGPAAGTIALHHVFSESKTYTVTLTATDSNGGVGTAITTVFVQPATPLGVTLNASANIGVTQTIETFTATVTGLGNAVVNTYFWEFGNGDPPQTTTTNQITHAYVHGAITYTARVTVTTSAPPPNNTATNTTAITP